MVHRVADIAELGGLALVDHSGRFSYTDDAGEHSGYGLYEQLQRELPQVRPHLTFSSMLRHLNPPEGFFLTQHRKGRSGTSLTSQPRPRKRSMMSAGSMIPGGQW
ncbi:MAG: hypothetical protein U0W40_16050 [Acidimicrobiia bacterium]